MNSRSENIGRRLSARSIKIFREKIYAYYKTDSRDLPWRKRPTPYRVLVSEVMLQQTQVERVIAKYRAFLSVFPDFSSLANASIPRLLGAWSGLGYNRRALALKNLARTVLEEHRGSLPSDRNKLFALPGIGKYTAGAIQAFAFNKPAVFIDTNIRRVFIHEFFQDRIGVRDDELLPVIEQTMDLENPRKWYNALMDYGCMLRRQLENPNRRSAHYIRQSPFENSNRQLRGIIVKILLRETALTEAQIVLKTNLDRERVKSTLVQLEKEGMIKKRGRKFSL